MAVPLVGDWIDCQTGRGVKVRLQVVSVADGLAEAVSWSGVWRAVLDDAGVVVSSDPPGFETVVDGDPAESGSWASAPSGGGWV